MLLLTGCPGPGDRFTPDEATWVQPAQGKVCFTVTHAQDYKPALIAITLRGTPPLKKRFTVLPELEIADNQLCIPPTFYLFDTDGQYIVKFILKSIAAPYTSRSFTTAIEVSGGHIHTVPLPENTL